jgi:glucose-6-phosphate isomerase
MTDQWDRYRRYCLTAPGLGFSLDVSRVRFPEHYIAGMLPAAAKAVDAMAALEAGAIANQDENRMVGHYWLRAPGLAPTARLGTEIAAAIDSVRTFATQVRSGTVTAPAGPFRHVVHVGIGGSALGPQLLHESLSPEAGPVSLHFLDNIDPDGVGSLIRKLTPQLGQTLVSVVSKSGWTPTPWQVMTELERAYAAVGLSFAQHAVATSMPGTKLDQRAERSGWLARFPLWDWVGGRTSITSAVGLLPAALAGIDVTAFLRGAAGMDELTRVRDARGNPAMMLALMWHWLGHGRGDRHMVVLPYRDRLAIFARYLQQLVMESLGKRLDRSGRVVDQGLNVYGHKGATDQHAYVQQLREGRDDTFVTLIVIDKDEEDTALGDHLFGNAEGLRQALTAQQRDTITISLAEATPAALGALVALCERAVGLYAELIDVNAYHQPSVDKDIAATVLAVAAEALGFLRDAGEPVTAAQIAAAIGHADQVEIVYRAMRRQALRPAGSVRIIPGDAIFGERFAWVS